MMAFYSSPVKRHYFFIMSGKVFAAVLIVLVVTAAACRRKTEMNKGETVARAYDKVLYKSNLEEITTGLASPSDSMTKVNAFIDQWLRQQVLLHKAETNLDEEKKDVEKQLEEYRKSLLIFNYEREYISQRLDTMVTQNEIEEFYSKHQDDFILKKNIIKADYLKLDRKSPKLEKVKAAFKSESERDIKFLEEYSVQYAIMHSFNDNEWMLFDDLLKEIPIKLYDEEQYLRNNRFVETQDSSYIYLVNIKGFKIKDNVSPLSFETDNIRNMILNQRKLKLIEEMENKIYNEAVKNGEAEIVTEN
ncbi:MAG TPA: hypothetical protein VI757_13170 [Bacteroidia bacterium]|nr:hypothetical protein [Bacteroidia bacterium]